MSNSLRIPVEWIAEDLASIHAPNKTTQADVHNLLERWKKEETAMQITLELYPWEIKKIARTVDDTQGEYYDWDDPKDVAQAISDVISDYLD